MKWPHLKTAAILALFGSRAQRDYGIEYPLEHYARLSDTDMALVQDSGLTLELMQDAHAFAFCSEMYSRLYTKPSDLCDIFQMRHQEQSESFAAALAALIYIYDNGSEMRAYIRQLSERHSFTLLVRENIDEIWQALEKTLQRRGVTSYNRLGAWKRFYYHICYWLRHECAEREARPVSRRKDSQRFF